MRLGYENSLPENGEAMETISLFPGRPPQKALWMVVAGLVVVSFPAFADNGGSASNCHGHTKENQGSRFGDGGHLDYS